MKYQLQANAIAPLLARTISLGMALDDVKDEWLSIQKEQSQDQKRIMNMVTACCVIKENGRNYYRSHCCFVRRSLACDRRVFAREFLGHNFRELAFCAGL